MYSPGLAIAGKIGVVIRDLPLFCSLYLKGSLFLNQLHRIEPAMTVNSRNIDPGGRA
jgi:hypothetical protein